MQTELAPVGILLYLHRCCFDEVSEKPKYELNSVLPYGLETHTLRLIDRAKLGQTWISIYHNL